jgi:hypothetical protein
VTDVEGSSLRLKLERGGDGGVRLDSRNGMTKWNAQLKKNYKGGNEEEELWSDARKEQ